MSVESLYDVSELLIATVMVAVLLFATELGYRAGLRVPLNLNDVGKSQLGTISTASLGLLALLLGFTFAMSLSRYDIRKQLVTKEASALETAFFRARNLPEQEGKESATLLRKYVDVRLEFFKTGIGQEDQNRIEKETEQIQDQLWTRASASLAKDDRTVTTGLFIQSLNEAFSMQNERLAALENHVPQSVLVLLFTVATISLVCVGYGCGLGKSRHWFSTTMFAVLLVLVITVIMDVDRPRRGFIQVKQESMIRLRKSLEAQ
jgi:hypothetical protein